MSYIGAEPTTAAFPFDQFSGTGAATSFTLTYAPASATSILVAISGVMQNPNLYSVIGTTLSFSPAPPAGTNNISVLYLGLPVIGSSSPGNTAFLSSTDLTATAGQTVFASAGSYTPGFVQVYRNGARLGNADFTATNGTTITLANAATAGDLVTIEYYTLTSLVNALPLTGGTVTGSTTFNTGVNLAAVSGNVGIGTSSPSGKLDVKTATDSKITFNDGSTTGNVRMEAVNAAYSAYKPLELNGSVQLFATGGTERMRIDSSGNVGIGTTSNLASSKLDVRGRVRVGSGNSSGDAELIFSNYASATTAWNVSVRQDVGGANNDLKFLRFDSAGAYQGIAMQLDSSGNLLVGTTSTNSARINSTFDSGGSNGGLFCHDTRAGAAGSGVSVYFKRDASIVGNIATTSTTTSYVTSSDYRLKNTIVPMTGALAKVALLKPVTYKWKVDGSDGQGFIAHELAEVCPSAVTGEKDAVDADGNPQYQGIDVSFLVATLTAAIKELKAEFDAYKEAHP